MRVVALLLLYFISHSAADRWASGDPYFVLGIPKDSSYSDVRSAYKRLAWQWHPDRSDDPIARQAFLAIHKAYAILTNPTLRHSFDLQSQATGRPADYTGEAWLESLFASDVASANWDATIGDPNGIPGSGRLWLLLLVAPAGFASASSLQLAMFFEKLAWELRGAVRCGRLDVTQAAWEATGMGAETVPGFAAVARGGRDTAIYKGPIAPADATRWALLRFVTNQLPPHRVEVKTTDTAFNKWRSNTPAALTQVVWLSREEEEGTSTLVRPSFAVASLQYSRDMAFAQVARHTLAYEILERSCPCLPCVTVLTPHRDHGEGKVPLTATSLCLREQGPGRTMHSEHGLREDDVSPFESMARFLQRQLLPAFPKLTEHRLADICFAPRSRSQSNGNEGGCALLPSENARAPWKRLEAVMRASENETKSSFGQTAWYDTTQQRQWVASCFPVGLPHGSGVLAHLLRLSADPGKYLWQTLASASHQTEEPQTGWHTTPCCSNTTGCGELRSRMKPEPSVDGWWRGLVLWWRGWHTPGWWLVPRGWHLFCGVCLTCHPELAVMAMVCVLTPCMVGCCVCLSELDGGVQYAESERYADTEGQRTASRRHQGGRVENRHRLHQGDGGDKGDLQRRPRPCAPLPDTDEG
eukprot:TRINITY_DN21644_c0_g1_i1.p1 TRINITY_DN21644_c0_g1~~TRINITY_DN21644_c0_g1_i1.p1  ORF type:complete len:642 (+),score=38.63 TRINITY_DN21644_c0_g1_i1:26-1951(+)